MQTPHLEHGKSAAANFDPANYTYATTGYNGESDTGHDIAYEWFATSPELVNEAVAQQPFSGLRPFGHGAKCLHCGANLKWFVLFRDIRTGLLITTGTTCAEEVGLPDKGSLLRKRLAERITAATKLGLIDRRHPGLRQELERVVSEQNRAYFLSFLGDVLHKVNHYHELSDKQAATCKRLLKKGLDSIAQRAAEAANRKSAPAPEGRVEVTGKVLSVKEYDGPSFSRYDSGVIYRMLVEDDRGFRVFGSVPSSIHSVERGQRVSFVAALSPKPEDPTFAFFKRPTKARILVEPAPEAASVAASSQGEWEPVHESQLIHDSSL
jgi:hypothetical protein